MTVEELMKELEKLPKGNEVYYQDGEYKGSRIRVKYVVHTGSVSKRGLPANIIILK